MFSIRRMHAGDIEAVLAIENQSASAWSRDQVGVEIEGDTGETFCAVTTDDDRCIAWCSARVVGDEAELLKIAVHADYRRQGVGTALLHHLATQLTKRRVGYFYLEVRSQNVSAIRLYSQQGFQEVGRRPNYYRKPDDDALLFRKQLAGFDEPHCRRNE